MHRTATGPDPSPAKRLLAMLAAMAMAMPTLAAAADISYVDLFRSLVYSQTADAAAAAGGAFFSTRVFLPAAGGFDAAEFTPPSSPSPVAMSPFGPSAYIYTSLPLAGQPALDAAFPAGVYAYSLARTGGGSPATSAIDYSGSDDYPGSVPYLNGTSYSNLQGMRADSPITVTINPYVNATTPDDAIVFFVVRDSADATMFDSGPLPAATTAITIPGGQLLAGSSYGYELIYSNRVLRPIDGSTDFANQIGFDYRTSGQFTTAAVPEPSNWALLLLGVAGLGWRSRRIA